MHESAALGVQNGAVDRMYKGTSTIGTLVYINS